MGSRSRRFRCGERAGWAPPRKVLVWNRTPQLLSTLQSAAPGVELIPAANEAEAVRLAADADAVIGFCSEEVLDAGPRIRWVQVFWAGVEDCVSIPALRERAVLLTNMQRVAGPVMAEHVVAMMLAFARGLQFFIPERAAGRWTDEPPSSVRMVTIEGKNVLVVGLGGIGTEVARRAHALGMRVTATRASGREGPEFVSYVGLPDELHKLAADADFIVNTTPLTPQTTGIFNAAFFAAAKPGAYFFNVGRGGSVVEADLVAALESGRIAGAGLDVTDPEPLPADARSGRCRTSSLRRTYRRTPTWGSMPASPSSARTCGATSPASACCRRSTSARVTERGRCHAAPRARGAVPRPPARAPRSAIRGDLRRMRGRAVRKSRAPSLPEAPHR